MVTYRQRQTGLHTVVSAWATPEPVVELQVVGGWRWHVRAWQHVSGTMPWYLLSVSGEGEKEDSAKTPVTHINLESTR